MISLTIKDTKTFMSHLLIKDTFDNMLLSEAAIVTGNTYNINGSINRSFFSDDELASLAIFLLSEGDTSQLAGQTDINPEDINGLFINIRYSDSGLTLVTGTSVRTFTLDKSLEHAFDSYVKVFLETSGINYEEIS